MYHQFMLVLAFTLSYFVFQLVIVAAIFAHYLINLTKGSAHAAFHQGKVPLK